MMNLQMDNGFTQGWAQLPTLLLSSSLVARPLMGKFSARVNGYSCFTDEIIMPVMCGSGFGHEI